MKEDIVIGCLYKMDVDKIHPFVSSLFASGTKAKLILFCSSLDKEVKNYLESYNTEGKTKIECCPFFIPLYRLNNPFSLIWPLFHQISAINSYDPDGKINGLFLKYGLNLMCVRFYHYYWYLKKNKELYNRVIMSDLRDVVFQSDPFEYCSFDGIESFCENSTIGDCEGNSNMVREALGDDVLEKVSEEMAVCAGVVCGTINYTVEYLKLMLSYLLKAPKMDMVAGADQGIHNGIMHHVIETEIPTKYHKVFESYCLTMGKLRKEDFTFDEKGRILNTAGEVISILHQYDRIKEFSPFIQGEN